MTSRNFEDFGIISPRLGAESKKPRSSRARRVRSESKLIKNLHFGIEPLESRIALSISTASYAAYDGSFNDVTSKGNSFSIVASDQADNLFLTNTVNGLWASNNSSFFSPVPVAQTTSMYITNASAGSDTNLIPNGYPFLSDSKTMRFMSENESWDPTAEYTGWINYTQPDGTKSEWTFTNWTGGIDKTLSPDTLRITSGPGYGGVQVSLNNTNSSSRTIALPGWSVPQKLTFKNNSTLPDPSGWPNQGYTSSYLELLWNTTIYPTPTSSKGTPTIVAKYVSQDYDIRNRAQTETLVPCSASRITFDIQQSKHLESLGVVPGSLEGTLSLNTGTEKFFLNRAGQIIFRSTNTTTGYVGARNSRNMITGITGSYATNGSLHFDLTREKSIDGGKFAQNASIFGLGIPSLSTLSVNYLTYNQDTTPNLFTAYAGHNINTSLEVDLLTPGSTSHIDSPVTGSDLVFRSTNVEINAETTANGFLTVKSPSNHRFSGYQAPSPTAEIDIENGVSALYSPPNSYGFGYNINNPPVVSLDVPSPQNATAVVTKILGRVSKVSLTDAGANYQSAIVTISPPTAAGGTTATATATIRNGSIFEILMVEAGSGYEAPPNVTISGVAIPVGGAVIVPATATSSINAQIAEIQITSAGTNYNPAAPPFITITGGSTPARTTATIDPATNQINGYDKLQLLNNPGGGFLSINATTVSIDAPPKYADAKTAKATATVNNGEISKIIITEAGIGYDPLLPPKVFIWGGGTDFDKDSPADGIAAVDAQGSVTSITITNPKTGYTSPPTVWVVPPPMIAAFRANVDANGSIKTFTSIQPGKGYSVTPNVEINSPTLFSNASADTKIDAFGSLTQIDVTGTNILTRLEKLDNGGGYTSAPVVTISKPTLPGGRSAVAVANIFNNELFSLTLTDNGSGYDSAPTVTLSGGGGSGATAVAVMSSLVGGYGYSAPPRITIDPPPKGAGGSQARGQAIVDNQGRVLRIELLDAGSGYISPPSVQVQSVIPVALSEHAAFDALSTANNYDIRLADDPATDSDHSLLFVSSSGSLSNQSLSPSQSIYIEVRDGDISVEGIVNGTLQTYLMNSTASHSERAPFVFSTRSVYTGANTGSIEGTTVQLLLGNETPTPLMGSTAFNIVDLQTSIQSLRVRAGSSQGNPNGPFPYQLTIDEKDGISIDAVAATSFPITLTAGGNIVLSSGLNTAGDVNVIARSADPRFFTQFVVSAPIASTVGVISILADTILINNTLQVTSAAVTENRNDISLTATRGDIYLQGLVSSVNNILLDQSNKVSTNSNKIYGPSRLRAEEITVRSQGSVQLRTEASLLQGYAASGFSVEELDDINIPFLSSGGIVSLTANGVDPGFSGNNSIALRARLVDVLSLVTSVPNGTVDINVDTSKTILMGNPVAIQQSKAEEMKAGGNVFIRSKGGDITALDAPLAGSSARQVRVATTLSLDATYRIENPGVYASTLTGKISFQSINSIPSSFDGCATFRVGDRVLVKNQGDLEQNGVYTVTAVGGGVLGAKNWQLTRSSDSDTTAELLSNSFVQIGDGKTLRSAVYQVSYNSIPRTVGERVNSNQLQLSSHFLNYSDLFLNQGVTGTGITKGTKIIDFDTSTGVITLGLTTSVAVQKLDRFKNSVTLTPNFAAYSNLFVGQSVSGRGLSDTVTITSFNPTLKTVTLSGNDLLDPLTNPTSLTFGIKVDSSKTTPSTIGLDSTFSGYSALYVGQPVYGQGIRANSVILSINSKNRTIAVTPGSVTSPTDLKSLTFGVIQGVGSGYITFEMPQLGIVPIQILNPSLTGSQVTWVNSTTLKLPASFSNIERLASSQVISGFGIAQGTTIAEDGINYAERTITLSRPVESQFPRTFSSGVMFRELLPSLVSDIGSDSPNRTTTFVVSTNGSSNLSPGGLGKMISLRQTNDGSRNPTNPDQNMDFKFWVNNPGNIQLSQELPVLKKAFTIDALDRFAGGNTGIPSGTGKIIVDGSRILKTRLNSLVHATDVINGFHLIQGSGIVIDTIKATLNVNQTSLPPLPLSVDITRLSIGTGVRGDGIGENTTIININKITRSIELSNGPSRNIKNSNIQFYNINGGLSIKNLTVCGFGSGAAFRIDNADGVIIDRNTIGSNAANARSGNQYGVLVTGPAANLSTISNNTVVGSTIAAIRIEAGASNTRLVGNTVGTLNISNVNGIELVSDKNSVGVNPIEPNPVVTASVPLTMNSFRIILPSTISPSNLASIRVGLGVFGDGIRTGTTILSLDTSTREIILSNPVTLSTASSDIFFGHLASTSITSNRVQLTSWPVLLNLTAGSKTVTLPLSFPTKALSIGKTVYGDGIADGTTISTINGFIITLSKNIVSTVPQSAVSFENSIPLENLYLGQSVTGDNFDSGTTISNIDIANRTIWLSKNPISEGYGLVHFTAGAKNSIAYNVNGIVVGLSFQGNLTAKQKQIVVSSTFQEWSSITVGTGVSYPNAPLNTTITNIDQANRTITLSTIIPNTQSNTRISFNIANKNIITNTKIFNNSFDGIVLAGGSNNKIGTDAVSAVVTPIDPTPIVSTTSVRLTSWPVAVQLKNTSLLVSIPASFKDFSSLKKTMRVYGEGIAPGTTILSIDEKNRSITLSTKPLSGFVSGISTISFGLDASATFTTAIPWNSLFIGQTVTSTSSGVNIISVVNTGNGYKSAPLVTLTGGGGIGATAIAEFDIVTKRVTRIRVTNPGTGYTSAPMVRVSGGGNATADVALAIAQLGTGIPEYTSIVAINTLVGYITLSPPQAGQSSFYLNDFSATLTFALRTQTSNAIYGNGGWGINILVENKNLIARNYFNTESPGTATVSSNKKGVIGSNSFRALAYIPGELSKVDSYGNQHGAASQNYTPGGGGSGGGGSGGGRPGGVPGTIPKPPVIFPY